MYTVHMIAFRHLVADLTDEAIGWAHALCPLRPGAVIHSLCLGRVAGFDESSVYDSSGDTGSAATDGRFRSINALRLKKVFKLLGGKEGLVFRVEQVGDRDGDGVWKVTRGEA